MGQDVSEEYTFMRGKGGEMSWWKNMIPDMIQDSNVRITRRKTQKILLHCYIHFYQHWPIFICIAYMRESERENR